MEDGVWRTILGRRVFIKNGQSLNDAVRESGKFNSLNNAETNIKSSESFKNNIDIQVQENVLQYTKELTDEYQDVLSQENIVWKTFTIGDEVANSNYNLNPKYFKNIEEARSFIRNNMNNNFSVKCDDELKYIVAHEVGHKVSRGLYDRLNQDKLRTVNDYEKWNNKFMQRVEKRYKEEISENIDYTNDISKYSASNPKRLELFSECFAEYTSSSTPRPFAKIFGEELEKERKLIK